MGDMVESASPVGTALVPVAPELPDRPASDLELPRVEDDYRKVASVGYLIIFVCFGLFGGWSYLAEIDSAAPAPGVVVVESYRKTVQHLEGGIVRDIAVREGDVVVAGDILVRLDDTRARAELELVRGRLYSSLAHEARLIAERDRQSTIEWSPILEWAARIDARASDAMKLQRQAFAARRAAQQGEAELLRQRIEQLNSKIDGLQAQRTSLLTLELSYRDEVKDFRKLYEEKFSDRPRLRQLERQAAEAAGDAGENQAALAGVYLEIGETRQQILQLEKEFHAEELKVVQTEIFDMQERQRSL